MTLNKTDIQVFYLRYLVERKQDILNRTYILLCSVKVKVISQGFLPTEIPLEFHYFTFINFVGINNFRFSAIRQLTISHVTQEVGDS